MPTFARDISGGHVDEAALITEAVAGALLSERKIKLTTEQRRKERSKE